MSLFRALSVLLLALLAGACSVPFVANPGDDPASGRALAATIFSNSAIQVQFSVDNDWGSGYTATLKLTNKQTIPVNGWDLEWANSPALQVQSFWNATITAGSATTRASPLSYNATIPAGATISFSYNASGSGAAAAPTWVKFKNVLIGGTTATPAPALATGRPVDHYGQLKVVGNRITDKNGQAIQLRGVSSHGLQWFPFTPHKTVNNLVSTFKIDVVRAAMYVHEWDAAKGQYAGLLGANPEAKQELLDVVEDAIDAGIYVIVDWHIHWNPPNASNTYWTNSPYTAEAVQFFHDIGQLQYQGKALKDYPNLIWEVMNEPGQDISWTQVKVHADQVIQQIRVGNNDPDNLILVPATNWAQALDTVARDSAGDRPDRVTGNVAYTLHFYTGSHGADLRAKAQIALDNGLAIFADEWGASSYTGNGLADYSATQVWVDWMNSNKISWASWSVSDKNESTALLATGTGMTGPWDQTKLSTAGLWIQNWITQNR